MLLAACVDVQGIAYASASAATGASYWKLRAILGDLGAAVIASFVVTPLTQIVDVAVSRSAGGSCTVLQGLAQGATDWLTKPFYMLRQPAFKFCWFVYLCTYITANLIENICVLFLKVPFAIPKLLGVTLANMLACIYKDAALAKIFGKSDNGKPFPVAGYLLFVIRDLLANAGGFTFPPMVLPLLIPWLGAGRAAVAAQLGIPAAINIVSSPIHFLALTLYNNPKSSMGQHLRAVAAAYTGATSSRIVKGLAAYGIGGVSNTALRARVGMSSFN